MEKLPSLERVSSQMALLVEGRDEEFFFKAMLAHLGIPGVLIVDVGGNRKFNVKLPALINTPGFRESVKSYAIVRDAEASADAAFASVRDLLRLCQQPHPGTKNTFAVGPPKVGVYIMPGNADSGMLEDLCMATVAGNPVVSCVDAFMLSVAQHIKWQQPSGVVADAQIVRLNNPSKAKAKAFLAVHEKDLSSMGTAAQAGVWKFDHESMKSLREFLLQLMP
jgi:hypothetical protein